MKEKIKTGISVLIILILFPYVAAVFRTGSMSGTEQLTLDTGLEQLVAEILPVQIPVSYEKEALKAQAVIIRTNLLTRAMQYYGLSMAAEAADAVREEDLETLGFDFYSREEQIRLWGYEAWEQYAKKCSEAAEETAGQVLAFAESSQTENKEELRFPSDIPYHAVSAGVTRNGAVLGEEYSWLESVECAGDLQSADYLKIETGSLPGLPEILARDEAGYVTEVRLEGGVLGGEEFRKNYGLNSSCFTAEETEEGVRIVTKGLGHGLGMSLYQANLRALSGSEYEEILLYFYKNLKCISFS